MDTPAWTIVDWLGNTVVLAAIVLIFGQRVRDWLRAGAILIHCGGPTPKEWLIAIAFGLFSIDVWRRRPPDSLGDALSATFTVSLITWILLRRNQVRENGVWFGDVLFPWSALRSYSWEGEQKLVLDPFQTPWRPIEFPVPDNIRGDVDRVLRQHVKMSMEVSRVPHD